jgi:hypothetical protein
MLFANSVRVNMKRMNIIRLNIAICLLTTVGYCSGTDRFVARPITPVELQKSLNNGDKLLYINLPPNALTTSKGERELAAQHLALWRSIYAVKLLTEMLPPSVELNGNGVPIFLVSEQVCSALASLDEINQSDAAVAPDSTDGLVRTIGYEESVSVCRKFSLTARSLECAQLIIDGAIKDGRIFELMQVARLTQERWDFINSMEDTKVMVDTLALLLIHKIALASQRLANETEATYEALYSIICALEEGVSLYDAVDMIKMEMTALG